MNNNKTNIQKEILQKLARNEFMPAVALGSFMNGGSKVKQSQKLQEYLDQL